MRNLRKRVRKLDDKMGRGEKCPPKNLAYGSRGLNPVLHIYVISGLVSTTTYYQTRATVGPNSIPTP